MMACAHLQGFFPFQVLALTSYDTLLGLYCLCKYFPPLLLQSTSDLHCMMCAMNRFLSMRDR